jgi:hypothetical protein
MDTWVGDTVRGTMADKPDSTNPILPFSRDMYLPEVGPPRRKVRRPSHIPPIPPGMYLTETGRPKGTEKR